MSKEQQQKMLSQNQSKIQLAITNQQKPRSINTNKNLSLCSPTPPLSPTTCPANTQCEPPSLPTPSKVNPLSQTLSQPLNCAQGNHTSSCITCSHCGKIYTHRSSLSKHIKKVHSFAVEGSKRMQCNMCCERYNYTLYYTQTSN